MPENRQAAFDVAGAGNATMVAGLRAIAKAVELPPAPTGAHASPRRYLRGPAGAIPVGYSPMCGVPYDALVLDDSASVIST